MLEFALKTPSSEVVIVAVWRLFDRLSSGPNFQVLLADLIWRASLLNMQGALPGSFFVGSLLNGSFFCSLGILSLLVGSFGLNRLLPNRNLLLVYGVLLQGSFLGLLLFDRRFLARVLVAELGSFLLPSLLSSLGVVSLLVGFLGISLGLPGSFFLLTLFFQPWHRWPSCGQP